MNPTIYDFDTIRALVPVAVETESEPPPPQPARLSEGPADDAFLLKRAAAYEDTKPGKAEGDGRNHDMYKRACEIMVDFALGDAGWPLFVQENLKHNPPLGEIELREIWDNAAKYHKGVVGSKANAPMPTAAASGDTLPAAVTPRAYSLLELAEQPLDNEEVLVGTPTCRYLERCAPAMLASVAGCGKSHIKNQLMVGWACGRTVFNLPPTRPLRSTAFQAEDPPNDAREMAANMIHGLELTEPERAAVHANTRQLWLPGCTGTALLSRMRASLTDFKSDIVFLDPLAAFAPGDLVRPEVVQEFCRSGLGALAVEFKCALFILHHVPKPNAARDSSRMNCYDFQYSGFGSSDVAANWPRVVLYLQPLARGEFLLRAAKRRPPWATETGEQRWELGLRHTPQGIWESFTPDAAALQQGGRPKAPALDTYRQAALALAYKVCPCAKTTFAEHLWHDVIGARNRARDLVDLMLTTGPLVCRPGRGRGAPVEVGLPEQFAAREAV